MRVDPEIVVDEKPEVYRPADDSFLLLRAVSVAPGERFLDVGTGTGLVALHAARITTAVATDVTPDAVALARHNARRSGVALEVVWTDLMAGIKGPFDVVAFNPPYLEGRATSALERAWDGGADGSEVSVRFLNDLPRILSPSGRAYVVLSRENARAREVADAMYRVAVLGSKPLFFERLDALELRQ